ncbi:hypothetical protein PCANC_04642 [Puccinia coronata f. sp. avenae]|uniref:Uncharacterized protein n=1 Tax=Puccinia coronata f. sp. avenae TaxID=200324 RepID=A0A2N5W0B5_9BASI|nr:hypothetical protein PCANC_04642 [Puccinia coronata f. sp. avenae]
MHLPPAATGPAVPTNFQFPIAQPAKSPISNEITSLKPSAMPERTLSVASTSTSTEAGSIMGLPPHRKQQTRKGVFQGALDADPREDEEMDSCMPSIRSLNPLFILPSHPSRLALSRIDSTASTVLPPKVDTTEALVMFNGKATLMSLNSFTTPDQQRQDSAAVNISASSSNTTIPTSNVLSKSLHAAASPSDFVKTLHTLGSSRNPTPPQPQKLLGNPPSMQPKPMVPGFITTCGSVPVVSKFLGPRAAPAIQPVPLIPLEAGCSGSSGPDGVRCSPDSPSATTTTARKAGAENSGTLGRIQKKLLMERDRPISPLFDSSPPTPAGPPPAATPLPPPPTSSDPSVARPAHCPSSPSTSSPLILPSRSSPLPLLLIPSNPLSAPTFLPASTNPRSRLNRPSLLRSGGTRSSTKSSRSSRTMNLISASATPSSSPSSESPPLPVLLLVVKSLSGLFSLSISLGY